MHSICLLCAGRCFFFSILLYEISVNEQIAPLFAEPKGVDTEKAEAIVDTAVKAVDRLCLATDESFVPLCQALRVLRARMS